MPRTKKSTGRKTTSFRPTTSENRPVTTWSTRSVERRAKSRTQEETSRTTRTTAKRKSASADPPRPKCQRLADTRRESDSEDNTEEIDDTPLTKADIPKIVDAVLSNFSTEGISSMDDSQDNPHLGE